MDKLEPEDPATVGGYRLIGRLGAGGMGRVFLGTSPGGRKVAVKLIHREHANAPEFRARFAREIEAARRVGGFHTAPVVDADPDADPPWMVTAYIPGPSLQAAVDAGGPLSISEVRALGAGLAEGLAAIHACGLVHRDVKPSNVILADDGPRIIDFGIARVAEAGTMTTTGAVLGTFSYMSPEQVRGEQAGPASDVFAFGSTLAFAATGRPPFGSESIATAVHRIVYEPPDLSGLPAKDELCPLITACLAKNPAGRPPLSAIIARLGASGQGDLAGQPLAAAEPQAELGMDTRTAEPGRLPPMPRQPTEQIYPAQAVPERRRPRVTPRRAVPVVAAIVILAAVAAVIGSLLSSSGPSAPASPPAVSLAGVYSASRYGFKQPFTVAVADNRAWVTNATGNSVTEFNASNGTLIRTLSGGNYGFDRPIWVVADGNHIWVSNELGNSVTELSASDGSFVRTLSGGNYGFDGPQTILDDGTHLWIASSAGNAVTELSASDGSWIRTLTGGGYQFNYPLGLAFDGSHLWITNYGQNNASYSVTEVNAGNGSLVRVVSDSEYQFNHPAHVTVADGSIWVTNQNGNTVTQVNADDGALVRVLSSADYRFNGPSGIALVGAYLYITNISANSVDVIDAANGALEKIISGPPYNFDEPNSITVANSRAWVGNWASPGGNGSVTALKLG